MDTATKCKSILVVEDNDDIRDLVVDVLSTEGYSVFGVNNGREALRALKAVPTPCLVLLDMMMPWMNGWEFLEAQGKDARFANLPVVVMTALNAEKALVKDTALMNARGYIRKPIELDTLIEIVRVYCGLPNEASAESLNEPSTAQDPAAASA